MRLFDQPARTPRPRWTGRLDIVPWPSPQNCPLCTAPLHVDAGSDVLSLFWLHGYGAVVRTTLLTCPCGYRRHWHTDTINPRGLA